jgi:hypothetical protein
MSPVSSASASSADRAIQAQHFVRPKDADGDNDGDNDGDRAGTPKSASLPLSTSGSLGTKVNEMA